MAVTCGVRVATTGVLYAIRCSVYTRTQLATSWETAGTLQWPKHSLASSRAAFGSKWEKLYTPGSFSPWETAFQNTLMQGFPSSYTTKMKCQHIYGCLPGVEKVSPQNTPHRTILPEDSDGQLARGEDGWNPLISEIICATRERASFVSCN